MNIEEKINIPIGAYTNVIGKDSKNIILYSLYGIKVRIADKNTIIIESDDPVKLRNVKMDILSNIGNKYSVFEHPGIITNLLVYSGTKPFQFKKYKEDIQDKYRIVYSDRIIPQIVRSVQYHNNWEIYSRDKLLTALNRNHGSNVSYEVTIGRNTFYSANKTKEIKDIENNLYHMSNFRTISVGYGKDIKVKWDPILTENQVKYIKNKLDGNVDLVRTYIKSGSILVDTVEGTRNHCTVQLSTLNYKPISGTFRSKIEKPIKETIVVSRLDMYPDIRYKFTTPNPKVSNITENDINYNIEMTMEHKNNARYKLSYSYVNEVIKYDVNGIIIKFVHNIFDNGNVIKFTSNDVKPIEILDYITNNIFNIVKDV